MYGLTRVPNLYRGSVSNSPNSGAPPVVGPTLFKALDGDSAIANLPNSITANGTQVSHSLRYEAKDATTSAWTPVAGTSLSIASTGTLPTVGLDTALTATADKAVHFAAGQVYQAAATTTGDLTTEDIAFECVFNMDVAESNNRIIAKRGTTGAGWEFMLGNTTGRLQFQISDGTNTASALYINSVLIGWNHYIAFVDRSENSVAGIQHYINGTIVSGAGNPSAVVSLSNAKVLTAGSNSDLASKCSQGVASFSLFAANNWFAGGATNTTDWARIANERASRLMGAYPSVAVGTAAPNLATRNSSGMLDKLTSGVRRMFSVGPNWTPRLVRRQELVGGETLTGAIVETAKTNTLLQSETFDNATWTKLACTVTANAGIAPDGTTDSDAIIGDVTLAQHGVSQSVTLTSSSYIYSTWALKGNQNFLLVEDVTVASCQAWFNLNTGVVGTVGAGVISSGIENWGSGLFRCWIRFAGTAAGHTVQLSAASADNTTTFIGDTVTPNIFVFGGQLEVSDHIGSYIVTTTAAVTRAADALTWVGNDGNTPATGPSSLSVDFMSAPFDTITNNTIAMTGGTAASQNPNGLALNFDTAADAAVGQVRTASVSQMSTTGTTDITDGEKHTLKITADTNSGKLFVDGLQEGATDTVLTTPSTAPVVIVAFSATNAVIANLTVTNTVT